MGNALLLALASAGNGLSPGTLHALMEMRRRNYDKLAAFIRWLATALSYGWFWLKKRPEILGQDGKPDYTGEGTQALIDAFWKRENQKDFVANLIRSGADLVLEWLKPDDFEWDMWTSLLGSPSPAAQQAGLFGTHQAALAQLLQQLLPQSGAGELLPTSVEARPGTRRPEAPAPNLSLPVGSVGNPVRSRTGGL